MTSANKYIQKTIQNEYKKKRDTNYDYRQIYTKKLIEFRKLEGSIVKVDKPSNIPRARELGYKAKQGVSVVFVKVRKGGGLILRPKNARRPKRMGINKITRRVSIQRMAEQKADKAFENLEVLNSYYVGEDGQKKYFEVIMVDPNHPSIINDMDLNWIVSEKHSSRAQRGLTSAGKKNRGLVKKGTGTEKAGPSNRAKLRKAK
ncbi:MAG: 50S ribosomal protein L15e [Candidatus ainarchaeum sp.]|jgi:large subunit ribosomal protein L15e|nr:50S ribosomal protein L15e [Candidatus ainarchaeum sp.]NCP71912.1 50S ribosomal protein L15e [archaeon]NCP79087.1 50S ribosomal protein L15e [archaeon]NCP97531.1 50S ribosomal protein L15e [archaeon]NCQ06854.1 50S ribosomal protein L15e [archaeon]